ncbi:MAG: hypothetical protein QW047_06410 [Sulfolobales archaeon]
MVLRLSIRICYGSNCVDSVGIANSGFVGRDPEITLPQELVEKLFPQGVNTVLVERVLADGSKVLLPKLLNPVDTYLITEDRVEGPIKTYAYVMRSRLILLNDAVLSRLHIVIIDPFEGLWCFRDELGRRERRGL